MRRSCLLAATLLLILPARTASAQFGTQLFERMRNAKSDINIVHPPEVRLGTKTRVAVHEFAGDRRCGPELTVRLTQLLQESNKVELIDRANLDAVLSEQDFQRSGAVDPKTAAKASRMLGPAALFMGRITNCSNERSGLLRGSTSQDKRGRTYTTYTRRLSGHLTASISLVDLTTGRVQASRLVDLTDKLENTETNDNPEEPSADELASRMYARAVNDMSRMVLPWSERVSVVVYDDDKCSLKRSAAQIRGGDLGGAVDSLRAAIAAQCGTPQEKKLNELLSKANHNLGIALTYSERPEDGLRALQTSATLRSSRITSEAIDAVNALMRQQKAQRDLNARPVALAEAPSGPAAPAAGSLTNKDVIQMVKAKLPGSVIVSKIKSAPCNYDTSTSALIALNRAGASEAVIGALTDAAGSRCR